MNIDVTIACGGKQPRLWKSCASPVQRSLYALRFFPCRAPRVSWTIGPRRWRTRRSCNTPGHPRGTGNQGT